MDAIKVDIAQELLALPNNEPVDFYQVGDSGVPRSEGVQDIWGPDVKIKRYEVVTKHHLTLDADNNPGRTKKNYLVPISDREMFEDLVDVSEYLLARLIDKKTKNVAAQERARIKGLAWWERLFKRF